MENNKRLPFIILTGVLLISFTFLGLNYFLQRSEIAELRSSQAKSEVNSKVLAFTTLFIKEVLQADGEVDFETRLSLENAVRALNDEEIIAEWQAFVGSKTEVGAQNSVKRLLGMLISKIQE